MSEAVPDWLRKDLDDIKDFMRRLPDVLDEKFLRRETFAEFRIGLEQRLTEIAVKVTDTSASTERAWRAIDRMGKSFVSKRTVYAVLGLSIATLAATAAWVSAVAAARH